MICVPMACDEDGTMLCDVARGPAGLRTVDESFRAKFTARDFGAFKYRYSSSGRLVISHRSGSIETNTVVRRLRKRQQSFGFLRAISKTINRRLLVPRCRTRFGRIFRKQHARPAVPSAHRTYRSTVVRESERQKKLDVAAFSGVARAR